MKFAVVLLALVAAAWASTANTFSHWDCCKPTCSRANTCSNDGKTIISSNTASGCDGGKGFVCSNNAPWRINHTLSYAFGSANFAGGRSTNLCCACFQLDYDNGYTVIMQATSTGYSLTSDHFDLNIPGSGSKLNYEGCVNQWNVDEEVGWGSINGIDRMADCASVPEDLQDGCLWRWKFLLNFDRQRVTYTQVKCPDEIVARSGCSLDP